MIGYLLAGVAVWLLLGGKSKPTTEGASGWVYTNPKTGLAEIHPTKQTTVLSWLGAYKAAPVGPDADTKAFGGAKAVLAQAGVPAIGAVQQAAQQGNVVLIAIGPHPAGPGNFWIGPKSILQAAQPGSPWAVLLGTL